MLIIINNSLQAQMLEDFELEAGQCRSLMQRSSKGSDVWNFANNRLKVVEESVRGLKEAMKNPLDFQNRLERGYTEDELNRLREFKEIVGNMKQVGQPLSGP